MERLMSALLNVGKETQKQAMIACAHNLNGFIQNTNGVHVVFEGLLNAMLVSGWTAFEVLAQDLHTRVIANHPGWFLHLTGSEDFNFQKRKSIRFSYENAFVGDGKIKNSLNEQCVDALALIRNLIVHKAGAVDQIFLDQCNEKYLTAWAALPIHKTFEPDGEIFRKLIDPNVKCGCRLIKAVDKWLSENNPNK